jgi:hypothetical protein
MKTILLFLIILMPCLACKIEAQEKLTITEEDAVKYLWIEERDSFNNKWAPAFMPIKPFKREVFHSKTISEDYAYLIYLPPSYKQG